MNFINSTGPRSGPGALGGSSGGGSGATPEGAARPGPALTLYRERPSGEISLEEFERYALDRLRVLKAIEEARLRSKSEDAIQADVQALLRKHMQCSSRQETARKDLVSHHILRLAYCRTADLRAWLLAHEALLFRCRFRALGPHEQADFFAAMGLPYAAIGDDEAAALRGELAAVALSCGDKDGAARIRGGGGAQQQQQQQQQQQGGQGQQQGQQPQQQQGQQQQQQQQPLLFYKVPFAAVPDLVGGRRVLLRRGAAYVAGDQLHSLVVGAFRAGLSAALAEAARAWAAFAAAEADRLAPLVDGLPHRGLLGGGDGAARKLPAGEVTAAQLPRLAAEGHLPLCMATMVGRVTSEHHIKHWGLQQLTLFVKAIGMPLEQALHFFRAQFAPRTPADKFDRAYAYNVRYNYGQEGKRADWGEWSCVKIISQEVGGACAAPGECNGGCPYKTLDQGQLRAALARLNCSEGVIRDVLDKARGRHYQLACGLAFEGVTGAPADAGINRPSDWYAASIEAARARAGGGGGGGDKGAAAAAAAGAAAGGQPAPGGGGGGGAPPTTPAPAAAVGPGGLAGRREAAAAVAATPL